MSCRPEDCLCSLEVSSGWDGKTQNSAPQIPTDLMGMPLHLMNLTVVMSILPMHCKGLIQHHDSALQCELLMAQIRSFVKQSLLSRYQVAAVP